MRPIIVALAIASLSSPATAQQLDPRIAAPLMQMINAAGAQCQAGNPQGCGLVQQLQQAGAELTQAQMACQQGNQQACQVLQMGAQQVMATYQQFQMGGGGNAPPMSGGFQGGGYSTQQMQADHQSRMQQQQGQFQQQQNQAAQQRQMNDEQNRRFMEQLRR